MVRQSLPPLGAPPPHPRGVLCRSSALAALPALLTSLSPHSAGDYARLPRRQPMNEDSLVVSSSTRTRRYAARACRPPPARASAIAERSARPAPTRSPAPGGPWSGFCVPLPSPTGAQRSPLCLRRPRPARGGTSAAGSSSSGSRRIVRPLGAQPAAAAEGSPDPAQGSQRSSEAAAHALPACHRWLRGRGRGRRGRWGTCWGDFGGSSARSRTRVVSRAAIFQDGCAAHFRV